MYMRKEITNKKEDAPTPKIVSTHLNGVSFVPARHVTLNQVRTIIARSGNIRCETKVTFKY